MYFWEILQIEPTNEKKAIKRAYAKLVKQYKPENSPEAYQKIREAYDDAMNHIKHYEVDLIVPHTDNSEVNIEHYAEKKAVEEAVIDTQQVQEAQEVQEVQEVQESDDDIKKIDDLIIELKNKELPEDDIRSIFNESVLINLKNRTIFEEKLFLHLTFCDQSEYSYDLAEEATKEFFWEEEYKHSYVFNEYFHTFSNRIDSARRYKKLEILNFTQKSQYNIKQAAVASLLTEEYNEKKLGVRLFFSSHRKSVNEYLNTLEKENSSAFDYDFNTETVNWWKNRANTHNLTFEHLIVGISVGFFPVLFFLLNNIEILNVLKIHIGEKTNLAYIFSFFAATISGLTLTVSLFITGKLYIKHKEKIKNFTEHTVKNFAEFFNAYQASHKKHAAISFVVFFLIATSYKSPEKIDSIMVWSGIILLGTFYKNKAFYIIPAILINYLGLSISQNIVGELNHENSFPIMSAILTHGIVIAYCCKKYGVNFGGTYNFLFIYTSIQLISTTIISSLFIISGAAAWLS